MGAGEGGAKAQAGSVARGGRCSSSSGRAAQGRAGPALPLPLAVMGLIWVGFTRAYTPRPPYSRSNSIFLRAAYVASAGCLTWPCARVEHGRTRVRCVSTLPMAHSQSGVGTGAWARAAAPGGCQPPTVIGSMVPIVCCMTLSGREVQGVEVKEAERASGALRGIKGKGRGVGELGCMRGAATLASKVEHMLAIAAPST